MECRTCGWAQDDGAPACPRCGSTAVTTAPLWERPPPLDAWAAPPLAPPPSGPPPRRATGGATRRGLALVVAAVGVVAVLGVGAVAVRAVTDGSPGASSPEEAVRRLAEAVDGEDPVAVAAALAPDEVAGLADLLVDVEDRAVELGLGPDADPLAGIDVTVDNLSLETEALGDDAARVTARSGRLGWSIDADVLGPTGAALAGGWAASGEVTAAALPQPFVVAVRRDGGWYVSLTYTLAQQVVDGLGLDDPDLDGDDGRPLGDPAETPEEAVTALVEAIGSGDGRDAAAGLPEGEWRVLVPYRDALEDLLDGEGFGPGALDLRVDDLDATVTDLDDGARLVRVEGAAGTYDDPFGDEWTWSADGWCVSSEDPYDEPAVCPIDPETYLGRALVPDDAPAVVVVPERGGWVVSPVRTVVEHVAAVLPALDVDVLVTLLGRPELVAPTGELELGTATSVALGPAGVTTLTFTPDRDLELVTTVDAGATVRVVGGDGGPSGLSSGRTVRAGQTHTVVVQREERQGDAPVVVSLGAVEERDIGEVSLSGTVDATLTRRAPVHRVTFTVDQALRARLDLAAGAAGGAVVSLTSSDGGGCSEGALCTFVPEARYTLTLAADDRGRDELAVSVGFGDRTELDEADEGEATIDGGPSVQGSLAGDDDRATHDLVVPTGVIVEVTVTASDPEVDLDVVVDDETYQAVGDETFTLDGPLLTTLEVYEYSGATTGYEVTVVPV